MRRTLHGHCPLDERNSLTCLLGELRTHPQASAQPPARLHQVCPSVRSDRPSAGVTNVRSSVPISCGTSRAARNRRRILEFFAALLRVSVSQLLRDGLSSEAECVRRCRAGESCKSELCEAHNEFGGSRSLRLVLVERVARLRWRHTGRRVPNRCVLSECCLCLRCFSPWRPLAGPHLLSAARP